VAASTTVVDFGTQPVGQYADTSFAVTNNGSGTLSLGGFTIDNEVFRLLSSSSTQFVSAGSEGRLTVRWFVDTEGAQAGVLRIATGDPVQPELRVALRGVGLTIAGTFSPGVFLIEATTVFEGASGAYTLSLTPLP
jgi:hypothetical protein